MEESLDSEGLANLALGLADALAVVDLSGHLRWANPAAEKLFGLHLDDLIGTDALELVHAEDREMAAVSLISMHDKGIGTPLELRVRAATGWKLIEMVGANLAHVPSVGGIGLCLRDLTERRRWEIASNDADRFRALVHNAGSILILLHADGRVESISAAVTRILGHNQELVEGRLLEEFVIEEERTTLRRAISRSRNDPTSSSTTVEVQLRRRDKEVPLPFELTIVNLLDDPTVHGLVVSGHDISQLRAARDRMENLATRDTLTGLLNRALILDRVEQMLTRTTRSGLPGSLLFVDVDHFKNVNDSLGHRVGDEVLRQVATRLVSALRASDTIGRLGGDEFVVLVEGNEHGDEAELVAERLLQSLDEPITVPSEVCPQIAVSVSIGISGGKYTSVEDLVADADIALYEAKTNGRNRFVRFEPFMRGTFHSRLHGATPIVSI
jgi:diguanylate cyclase (GGDEF)-like protein/PAS domain S-box-containing protein